MKILAYHEISPSPPQEVHAVAASEFTAQMDWLIDSGYLVLDLEQALQPAKDLPQKSIAITFDDGYLDNYTQALPVLTARQLPATVFLVSEAVGKTSFWRSGSLADTPMMTWAQAREMHALGISFGSHSCTHPDLTGLSPEALSRELADSHRQIEDALGTAIDPFSYPYSRFTPAVFPGLRAAGYRSACTYQPFYVGSCGKDPFSLQRIGILATDTINEFAQKVQGSLRRQLQWVRYTLRRQMRGEVP